MFSDSAGGLQIFVGMGAVVCLGNIHAPTCVGNGVPPQLMRARHIAPLASPCPGAVLGIPASGTALCIPDAGQAGDRGTVCSRCLAVLWLAAHTGCGGHCGHICRLARGCRERCLSSGLRHRHIPRPCRRLALQGQGVGAKAPSCAGSTSWHKWHGSVSEAAPYQCCSGTSAW